MNIRILGALLVIAGCGSFGLKVAANHIYQEKTLRCFVRALDYMECELRYRLTPLPVLCEQTGQICNGVVREFFLDLSQEMEAQISPDVECCIEAVLSRRAGLPKATYEAIVLLGQSMGKFDLEGQLKGLDAVRQNCRRRLDELTHNKDSRIRSYQTLGLCTGAALAILFI